MADSFGTIRPPWWGQRRRRPTGFLDDPDHTTTGTPGRWPVLAGRAVLYGALAVVLAAGLKTIVFGSASRPVAVRPVPAVSGPGQRFPAVAAEAFAAEFTRAYLTWPDGGVDAYRRAVAAYLPPGGDALGGWNGTGHQTVAAVIPAGVVSTSDRDGTVTVAAALNGGGWIHLAVPVTVQGSGLVVAGTPAIVPGPPAPQPLAAPAAVPSDDGAADEARPTLARVFAAYGSGDDQTLTYLAAPGVHLAGLAGAVSLVALDGLSVDAAPGDSRIGHATVRWALAGAPGSTLTQTYRVDLVRRDGRWYVAGIDADRLRGPGMTGPAGATPSAATPETTAPAPPPTTPSSSPPSTAASSPPPPAPPAGS